MKLTVPGINIQWPWSELILSGKKRVETRGYPLPARLQSNWIAVIETPGKNRRKSESRAARVTGLVRFSQCVLYKNKKAWESDKDNHLVEVSDENFGFRISKPKFGWLVESYISFREPISAPRKGIVYAKPFSIKLDPDAINKFRSIESDD